MELELNNVELASQWCRQSDINILQQTVVRFSQYWAAVIIISQMRMFAKLVYSLQSQVRYDSPQTQ